MNLIADRNSKMGGETSVRVQRRSLVVEIFPWGVEIWQKGRQKSYYVRWGAIYLLGAEKARIERKAAKGRKMAA